MISRQKIFKILESADADAQKLAKKIKALL